MAKASSRSRTAKRVAVGALVVAVGVGVGIGVSDATASGRGGYRTAVVTVDSVNRTLGVGGTTQPVHQATASFQVSGTVTAVKVESGQHVSAGQVIATLDSTVLQEQVSVAQTNLAAAQAVLAENEAGQAAGTGGSNGGNGGNGGTGSASAQTAAIVFGGGAIILTAAVHGSGSASLQQAQQAVVNAQHTADMDLQTAGVDLRAAESTCSSSSSSTPPTTTAPTTIPPTTSTSPTTSPTTTQPTTTSPTTTQPTTTAPAAAPASVPTPPTTTSSTSAAFDPVPVTLTSDTTTSSACTAALNQAMTAESQVGTDQKDLADAENTLAEVLASLPTTPPSSGHGSGGSSSSTTNGTGARRGSGSGTGSAGSGTGTGSFSGSGATGSKGKFSSTGSSGSGSSSSGRTGGSGGSQNSAGSFSNSPSVAVNSAQQLASDQATIDSDQATLVKAQQALADAQLVSPMAGTVASVTLQAGQSVSVGSTADTVQIINSGAYQTTASLTTSQVATVKVGDPAQVTVDGTAGSLSGVVSRVGPVLVSGSTYSYPVVVALQTPGSGIAAGSAGQLQIDLAQAANVLVVPTSAVHTATAGRSYVMVLRGGHAVIQTVTVGVVGATYTQIVSGLTRGTTVVLANLSTAVPSSSTNSNTGRFGGLGGGGGGGGFAGLGGGGGFIGRGGGGGGGAGPTAIVG